MTDVQDGGDAADPLAVADVVVAAGGVVLVFAATVTVRVWTSTVLTVLPPHAETASAAAIGAHSHPVRTS